MFVDDEQDITFAISIGLEDNGFQVSRYLETFYITFFNLQHVRYKALYRQTQKGHKRR